MSAHPQPDLTVALCGVQLPNPLILASGILGTEAELLARVARAGAGAVTSKSCGPQPRAGHPNPTVLAWEHGLINAVGLANPGVEAEVEELVRTKALLGLLGATRPPRPGLIASVFADTVESFGRVAARVADAGPDFIEVNISCPNVHDEFGTPFAADASAAAEVTAAVKEAVADRVPVLVKLSPNVTDVAAIARAVVGAGADALSLINTLTALAVDTETRRPVLANGTGGLSGPAIRPIAVHMVRRVYTEVARPAGVPVIGMGGIQFAHDAIEFLLAGATAVAVGTALFVNPRCLAEIREGIDEYLARHGHRSVKEIIGALRAEG